MTTILLATASDLAKEHKKTAISFLYAKISEECTVQYNLIWAGKKPSRFQAGVLLERGRKLVGRQGQKLHRIGQQVP